MQNSVCVYEIGFSYAAVRLLYTTMFVCFTVAVLFLQQQPPLCPGMLHVCGVWARTIVCPGFPIGMRGGGAHTAVCGGVCVSINVALHIHPQQHKSAAPTPGTRNHLMVPDIYGVHRIVRRRS